MCARYASRGFNDRGMSFSWFHDKIFPRRRSVFWGVINNAGVAAFGDVEFIPVSSYKRQAEVNLWGTVRVTQAFLPFVRKSKGELWTRHGLRPNAGNWRSICGSDMRQPGDSPLFSHSFSFGRRRTDREHGERSREDGGSV